LKRSAQGRAPAEAAATCFGDQGGLARGKPARVGVAVRSASDLDHFARRYRCGGDALSKKAILTGDVRFEIAGGRRRGQSEAPAKGGSFHESGVLGETKIVELGALPFEDRGRQRCRRDAAGARRRGS
jgi:hypothetical protein